MLKKTIAQAGPAPIVLMDTITKITQAEADCIVISGSHGGVSAGEFASAVKTRAVFFNDAGVGKDQAGIAALAMLDAIATPAATVSHQTARIGDAEDMWNHGVLSHVNEAARSFGLKPGEALRQAVAHFAPAPSRR